MEEHIKIYAGTELDYLVRSDGVPECRQSEELNQSSLLKFRINSKSPKAKNLYHPNVIAECDGKRYCFWGETGINKIRSIDGVMLDVEMKELWYRLSKRYLTAYNIDLATSTKFDHIDTHMVVVYGNSPDQLYINGETVTCPYPVGTSKYHFWCVLYGTGWSLDPQYEAYWPGGKFDLETDKKSVLDNIKMLQEFFGGMLLWDSINMTMALVDEDKYQKFGGYEARYAYNLKGIEKRENRNITTRLYVYGNNNLNIAAVNGGKEYIDNFSYTAEIIEDIAPNNDIYEQDALLAWGKRQSETLCKPRYEYDIQAMEYTKNGFSQQPPPVIGELARIIDEEIVGDPVMQRIISIDRNVWDKSDLNIKAGDIIDTFKGKFAHMEKSTATTRTIATSANQISNSALLPFYMALSAGNVSVNGNSITGTVLAAHIDWQGAESMTLNIGNINANQIAIIVDGRLKTVGAKAIEGQDGLFLYVEQ